MLILQSSATDVYRNLAIEEYLMEHIADRGPVLFLWQSDCAVVMGKNQNPWRECRLDLMEAEGVPLARRISGGGTVYHDAGNLNYCVIVDRTHYREEQAYEMVFQALETMGIHAEKTGKSNLSVDGLKFSGNAFCFRKGRALHHGTLLLRTDLERLNRYLGPMFGQIETHAIRSIPATVANLGLDDEAVASSLKDRFQALYGGAAGSHALEEIVDETALWPRVEKQRSHDWKFGATPGFVLEQDRVRLEVAKGVIVAAQGAGAECFLGRPFSLSLFQ
ncbi:MAG: lipoate--protein ligase [Kiritimatiellales bacterium]|nr:lipoate--protein ligase [Kiritimatiellales bacterium]MCF7863781.1 lipoate--protein ligase [Kiritimatiellales bacterium]